MRREARLPLSLSWAAGSHRHHEHRLGRHWETATHLHIGEEVGDVPAARRAQTISTDAVKGGAAASNPPSPSPSFTPCNRSQSPVPSAHQRPTAITAMAMRSVKTASTTAMRTARLQRGPRTTQWAGLGRDTRGSRPASIGRGICCWLPSFSQPAPAAHAFGAQGTARRVRSCRKDS